ncbi:hypothetical protein [Paracoccus jeotgali]|uniref:hypothetical protein n=1 Tax=Paracoccus jeotgali TaxID=2065379 RepID=UPI0028AECED0|nr:hypothetical protein [Paracoccus jeotgali]
MIVFLFALFGLALGWYRAGRVGGDTKDRAQWAFAHMFAFVLLGLLVALILARMS